MWLLLTTVVEIGVPSLCIAVVLAYVLYNIVGVIVYNAVVIMLICYDLCNLKSELCDVTYNFVVFLLFLLYIVSIVIVSRIIIYYVIVLGLIP